MSVVDTEWVRDRKPGAQLRPEDNREPDRGHAVADGRSWLAAHVDPERPDLAAKSSALLWLHARCGATIRGMDDPRNDAAGAEEWVMTDAEVEALYARERAGEDISLEESLALERWQDLQPDTRKWYDKGPVRASIGNKMTGRFEGVKEATTQWEQRGKKLCEQLVGLPLDDATEIAKHEGFVVREVSHRNGITAVTADFRADRITLVAGVDDIVRRALQG